MDRVKGLSGASLRYLLICHPEGSVANLLKSEDKPAAKLSKDTDYPLNKTRIIHKPTILHPTKIVSPENRLDFTEAKENDENIQSAVRFDRVSKRPNSIEFNSNGNRFFGNSNSIQYQDNSLVQQASTMFFGNQQFNSNNNQTEDMFSTEQRPCFSTTEAMFLEPNVSMSYNVNASFASNFDFNQNPPLKRKRIYDTSFMPKHDNFFQETNLFNSSPFNGKEDLESTFSEVKHQNSLLVQSPSILEFQSPLTQSIGLNEELEEKFTTKFLFQNQMLSSPSLLIEPQEVQPEQSKQPTVFPDEVSIIVEELQDNVKTKDILDITTFINKSIVHKNFTEEHLMKSLMHKEKISVNTAYTDRYKVKTSKDAIDSYYKLLLPKDWNVAFQNNDYNNLMEPSLDYLHHRLTNHNNVTLGSFAHEICEDENVEDGNLNDSLEDFEKSFDALNYSIISSTPKRDRSIDQRASQIEQSSHTVSSQNNPKSKKKLQQQETRLDCDDDDDDRTKSLLLIQRENPGWHPSTSRRNVSIHSHTFLSENNQTSQKKLPQHETRLDCDDDDDDRTKSLLLLQRENSEQINEAQDCPSTSRRTVCIQNYQPSIDIIAATQMENHQFSNNCSDINFEDDSIFSQMIKNVGCTMFNLDKQTKDSETIESQNLANEIEALTQRNPQLTDARRTEILSQIEQIFKTLIESLVQQKPMELKIRTIKSWADCEMKQGILSQNESKITVKTMSFKNKASERTFSITVIVMAEIYKMLSRNTKSTRRELYYSDVDLFRNQESVNRAIETLCSLLNVQEHELGILSASKGLVAGDLIINIDDERIDCSTPQAVPQNPSAITSFETAADYVLIVEKETVFQRLVNDNIFERIDSRIILITAKGYPDVNTRVLIKKLADDTGKPIYIIVDADPHGIEIMCTYKYGSMLKIHNSEHLAVPQIQWIGIHPSDIAILDVLGIAMTKTELKKVDALLKRPYMNPTLQRELNCFKEEKMKAEIESLFPYSTDFFINEYIPRKISFIEMPIF